VSDEDVVPYRDKYQLTVYWRALKRMVVGWIWTPDNWRRYPLQTPYFCMHTNFSIRLELDFTHASGLGHNNRFGGNDHCPCRLRCYTKIPQQTNKHQLITFLPFFKHCCTSTWTRPERICLVFQKQLFSVSMELIRNNIARTGAHRELMHDFSSPVWITIMFWPNVVFVVATALVTTFFLYRSSIIINSET